MQEEDARKEKTAEIERSIIRKFRKPIWRKFTDVYKRQVMIQVTYFKMTGGKRIFRMAPIHHHFELGGWSETRVVAVFSIVTALLWRLGLLAL